MRVSGIKILISELGPATEDFIRRSSSLADDVGRGGPKSVLELYDIARSHGAHLIVTLQEIGLNLDEQYLGKDQYTNNTGLDKVQLAATLKQTIPINDLSKISNISWVQKLDLTKNTKPPSKVEIVVELPCEPESRFIGSSHQTVRTFAFDSDMLDIAREHKEEIVDLVVNLTTSFEQLTTQNFSRPELALLATIIDALPVVLPELLKEDPDLIKRAHHLPISHNEGISLAIENSLVVSRHIRSQLLKR